MFQSRKRFRHCWSLVPYLIGAIKELVSIAKAIPSLLEPVVELDTSKGANLVSIAKAIPSLLEPARYMRAVYDEGCFNRESDSVTVGATAQTNIPVVVTCFNRESDSVTVGAALLPLSLSSLDVSIAKAIPSLLEHDHRGSMVREFNVSIAKAIPSLLEPPPGQHVSAAAILVSIAKAIPSLLERTKRSTMAA